VTVEAATITRRPGAARADVRVTSPAPRPQWRELLEADGHALVPQSPEWLDAICAVDGYRDASRLYETPWGTRMLLPMVRRSAGRLGSLAPQASLPPAWGMGGLVADRPLLRRDVEAVVEQLAAEPALRTTIRPNPLHAELWTAARRAGAIEIPRLAHVLDLDGGRDAVWERFASSARQGVRRAERSGVEVECDSSGRLVPVFYELLELSVERWAGRQHEPLALARWRARRRDPLRKFERLAAALGDAMRVWVARHEGRPVASILVLQDGNASYTRGAMDTAAAGKLRTNELLHWLAIGDACEAGCRHYHLGESGPSSSLARFKEKFGARPVPYSEYRFERLPLTRADAAARGLVKRALRFRDA
jgi:hypothetical protein